MIVLKIILWVILAILGIILLILITPASVELSYIDKKFTYKIRYGFLNLYDSNKKGLLGKFLSKRKKSRNADNDSDYDDYYDDSDDAFDEMFDGEPEITETDEDFRSSDSYEEQPEISVEEDSEEDAEYEAVDNNDDNDNCDDDEDEDDSRISKLMDKLDSMSGKIDKALDILDAVGEPIKKICKGFKFSKVYIDFMIADEDAYKCALKYGKVSGGVYNIIGWLMVFCSVKFKTVDIFPDFREKESRWDISAKLSFKMITPVIAGILFLITYIFKFVIPQKKQEKRKKSKKSEK